MKIKIQHINMQGAANTVLRLYSIALNTQIRQGKRFQINNLSINQDNKKGEQNKPRASRSKEIIQ